MKSWETPQYIQQMTDAEYKAWVEKGISPKRLEGVRKQEFEAAKKRREELAAKRNESAT